MIRIFVPVFTFRLPCERIMKAAKADFINCEEVTGQDSKWDLALGQGKRYEEEKCGFFVIDVVFLPQSF